MRYRSPKKDRSQRPPGIGDQDVEIARKRNSAAAQSDGAIDRVIATGG